MRGTRDDEKKDGAGQDGLKNNEPEKKAVGKVFKIGKEIIKPYTGKKNLPKAEYDSKGNITKIGEPRHFLVHADNKTYKLIRVYNGKGVKRSLVRALKVRRKATAKVTDRSIEDKHILSKLKEMELPGAF